MDVLSFIASIVGSLAWPATAFGIVLLLRKQLVAMLPYLRKLKAGPVEAEFEREVEVLEAESPLSLPPTEQKLLTDESKRLLELAQVSPRAAILEAWHGVEFAARNAVLHNAGSPIPEITTPVRVAKELVRLDLLSPEEIGLFHDLRGLRNQATHSPDFHPSFESVHSYLMLAKRLRSRLLELSGGAS
jgi:hypothetical protein